MSEFASHYIEKGDYTLHYKRIVENTAGPAVMLVHGSIEDGKIFYSKSGKGIAPFLAKKGFDVYVVDLRGKGESKPAIDAKSDFGQREAILEDMPDLISSIQANHQKEIEFIGAHSWGGVITLSYLARFEMPSLKGLFFFGSKRDVRVQNLKRWFNIDLLWNRLGTYLVHKYGYLPAVKYKAGSDNESKRFYLEVNHWVYSKDWIDTTDGFNYAQALRNKQLPPLLSLTGTKDTHSGHAKDVKRLLKEIGGQENHQFKLIGKKTGHKVDYDHINLLTHPKAQEDHFQYLVDWLDHKVKKKEMA